MERVRDIAIESVRNIPNINKDKDIELVCIAFGGSSIDFSIMIWVEYKSQMEFLKSQSEAIIALTKAIDKEGIVIPYRIRTFGLSLKTIGNQSLFAKQSKKESIYVDSYSSLLHTYRALYS